MSGSTTSSHAARSRLRWWLFVLAGLACLGPAGAGASTPGSRAAGAAGATVVSVGRGAVGRAIPGGFVGLSTEFRSFEDYAGQDPQAIDPVFLQLVRNLAPGQRPVLRIGGDSTDWTWFPLAHVKQPPGAKYSLNTRWLQVGRAVAQALDARLVIGINLEADSRTVAAGEAAALVGGIGRQFIDALEIGNEPELYGTFSWYHTASGKHVMGRPPGYDFSDFTHDFSSIARGMPAGVPLAGPSTGSPAFMAQLGHFISVEPRLGLVTLHAYPLKHCTPSMVVTDSELLSETSSQGLADGLAQYAAISHARHLPLRIDEMNAISCGGQPGVSDTFGAALWSLDTLFDMARVGVDGVNIHTPVASTNQLFSFSQVNGHWQAHVNPEYYGMMMFAEAAPAGSRLLGVSGGSGGPVRTWATRAPGGMSHVVLINTDTTGSHTVEVRVPASAAPAVLARLTAPSVHSHNGITIGGDGFGAETSTGVLPQPLKPAVIKSGPGGYLVKLPAASAAMLTMSAS
jgi:hypothetical protein